MVPVHGPPIPDGAIRFADGRIQWIGPWREATPSRHESIVDAGDNILLPGLVNAHCHLDYTHLLGLLAPPRAFPDWIKAILAAKASWSDADFEQSWLDGAAQLLRHGTTTVANIETQGMALARLRATTPLRLHSFLELTGVRQRQPAASLVGNAEQRLLALPPHRGEVGLSPHAPYSTLPEILFLSAATARRHHWRLTTHIAESKEEFEMFMYRRGPMHDWLHSQRPDSDCGIGSPVQHAARHGLLGPDFLAVHVNYLWDDDARLLATSGSSVVHCPRSHAYFRHQRFPFDQLQAAGVPVCLGTDSLASTRIPPGTRPELSLFSEMAAFAAHDSTVAPARILEMATLRGAQALGSGQRLGSLQPGFEADFCLIPDPAAGTTPEEAILHHTGPVLATWIAGRPVWCSPGGPIAQPAA